MNSDPQQVSPLPKTKQSWKTWAVTLVVLVVGLSGIYLFQKYRSQAGSTPAESVIAGDPLIELDASHPNALRFHSPEVNQQLGIRTTEVLAAGSPLSLRLPGTLVPDPDRFIRVNARFSGEVVSIGTVKDGDQERQLQYGDHVEKGQLLAVIWSKNIGEKKSELIDAYSKMEMNRTLLKRLESVAPGVLAETRVFEARRDLQADMIDASKIERTLRSWRLTEEEIDAVREEGRNIRNYEDYHDRALEQSWAETEVRAAMDGILMEKNFNVGDMIEHSDDLFKIADLTRLRVVAHIYEEDLWVIRAMDPSQRKWRLDLKSTPADNEMDGTFELISDVIDTGSRTGALMGWVDNSANKFAVGQFLTATIQLPPLVHEVAIPEKALIEEGDRSMVFVQDLKDPLTYMRRRVAVSRRSTGMVYLKRQVSKEESADHIEGLTIGENVVVSSALGLGGELEKLQSLAPTQ